MLPVPHNPQGPRFQSYAAAVYQEDIERIVNGIIAMLGADEVCTADSRTRNVIIAAALGTVAQTLDSSRGIKPQGITGILGRITDSWKRQ